MMKSKFSTEQVEAILKQAESGIPVIKLCEEHSISHVTFYRWRRKAKASAASGQTSATATGHTVEVSATQ